MSTHTYPNSFIPPPTQTQQAFLPLTSRAEMDSSVDHSSPLEVRRAIEEIQTRINDFSRVVNTAVENLTDENERLLTENDRLREQVRNLEGEVREQAKEIESLKAK
jgi:seryl-tRNA synthetase